MGIEWITALMFGSMLLLLAIGLPLAFVTGLIGVTFCLALYGPAGRIDPGRSPGAPSTGLCIGRAVMLFKN